MRLREQSHKCAFYIVTNKLTVHIPLFCNNSSNNLLPVQIDNSFSPFLHLPFFARLNDLKVKKCLLHLLTYHIYQLYFQQGNLEKRISQWMPTTHTSLTCLQERFSCTHAALHATGVLILSECDESS